MSNTKPFDISKNLVWEAYKRVIKNKGSAGVDGQTIEQFNKDWKNNLYKLWNRMSSGSYQPKPVLRVNIPNPGGTRPLGIPTLSDRIAQMTAKLMLEPSLESIFSKSSFGYRPGKSALDAIAATRKNCWEYDWVVDLDIKGFFDAIDHDLLMKAVKQHCKDKWVLLYIERWLKTDVQLEDGSLEKRNRGTPQGGVVSPMLSNLFLHYVFDKWMERNNGCIPFERYADDVICHCKSQYEAEALLKELSHRFEECGLTLHPVKTKLVYCKDSRRTKSFKITSFDFLGYTFRGRSVKNRRGEMFIGFNPAVSQVALKTMNRVVRSWRLNTRTCLSLIELAERINPVLRGWLQYYGRFSKAELFSFLERINLRLSRWARNKYKKLRIHKRRSWDWLRKCRKSTPALFVHWQFLYKPMVG
jgi:group II intron reverse transcriptase/maturase